MADSGKLDNGDLSNMREWRMISQNVGYYGQASKSDPSDLAQKLLKVLGETGDQSKSLLEPKLEQGAVAIVQIQNEEIFQYYMTLLMVA